VSIRTFDGQWLLAGDGIATSDDCCCPSPFPFPCPSPCDCAQGTSWGDCPACPVYHYCCDECCELGCDAADDAVIGGFALVEPNEAKGAFLGVFPSSCQRVGQPGQPPFPLGSNSIQYCTGDSGCPEGYAEVGAAVRIYDTNGGIIAERAGICCPIEVYEDPCASNPLP
jgi:hypothetical protein